MTREKYFSIVARAPVIRQSFDSFQEHLQTEGESYAITDGIGFDSAAFTLSGESEYLYDWYLNSLARDITWTASDGATAWEGFVYRLSLTIGAVTRTKSLDGMANRVIYVYTPLDTTVNPPKAEAQTSTTVNNTTSQARYGIKVFVASGSECTAATASDNALSILESKIHIPRGETVAIGRGGAPVLRVECLGYAHMANWYNYSQTANTGTTGSSTFIATVLAADLNSVLSSSTVDIDSNTTAIEKYHDGKQYAWKVIQAAAARGYETGGYGYPWSVGVYEHRETTFKATELVDANGNALSTNKYQMLYRQTTDAGDSILNEAGEMIMPWAVRPDRLLHSVGFPGEPMWIQQVRFSSPYILDLTGTDPLNPTRLYVKANCGQS